MARLYGKIYDSFYIKEFTPIAQSFAFIKRKYSCFNKPGGVFVDIGSVSFTV